MWSLDSIFSSIVNNRSLSLIKCAQVGDIMVLKDHINLPGFACRHPLKGPNDERFGPRFFPTNDLYNKKYRDIARQVRHAEKENYIELDPPGGEISQVGGYREAGVYAMVGGPNYETVAELKMLRELGVDSVGNIVFQQS